MGRRVLAGLVVACLFTGCDAAVKRTLPDSVKSLYIEPFQNFSEQSLLPAALSDEMRRAFRLDGRVAVAELPARADAVLGGTLTVYQKDPSRYDRNNIVQEYNLRIGADLTLVNPGSGQTLWPEPVLSATAVAASGAPATVTGSPVTAPGTAIRRLPRHVDVTITFTVVPATGLPVESEEDAQRRAMRELAQRIVLRVIEGW